MNVISEIEKQNIAKLTEGKTIPDFKAGDTVKVGVRIVEGRTERLQYFQGLCISRANNGINSSFVVRKISNGEGVERKFPIYSPRLETIEVVRRGVVRRAKLYYMRELRGKAARIKEKLDLKNNSQNKKKTKEQKKEG